MGTKRIQVIFVLFVLVISAGCSTTVTTGERITCPDCNTVIKNTVHQETVSKFKADQYDGIKETNERCTDCQTKFEKEEKDRLEAEAERQKQEVEIQAIKNNLEIEFYVFYHTHEQETITIDMNNFDSAMSFNPPAFSPTIYISNKGTEPIYGLSVRLENIPSYLALVNYNYKNPLNNCVLGKPMDIISQHGLSLTRIAPGERASIHSILSLNKNFPDGAKVNLIAAVSHEQKEISRISAVTTTIWKK